MKRWGEIMRGPGAVEPKDIERFERSQGNVDRCIGAALRELYERDCEGSAQTQRKLEREEQGETDARESMVGVVEQAARLFPATQSLRNSAQSEGLTLEQRIERLASAFLGLEEKLGNALLERVERLEARTHPDEWSDWKVGVLARLSALERDIRRVRGLEAKHKVASSP